MTKPISQSVNLLTLIYDRQSLLDLIEGPLPIECVTLLCPLSLKREPCLRTFEKIIFVTNYFHSGEIISLAIQEHHRHPFTGIIAPHEIDILRAATLRDYFNLPGQRGDSARAFRQKSKMKEILSHKGILVPKFQSLRSAADLLSFIDAHPGEIVVKPDLGTGSEGVRILKSREDALVYLATSPYFSGDINPDLQAETFVEGTMYHINGFYGVSEIIYSWPSIYPQQSIEMLRGNAASSYLLDAENPLVNRLNEYANTVLDTLPTPSHTPFHLEVFINKQDEIVFCEVACRIGGKGVRQSWKESLGISLSSLFYKGLLMEIGLGRDDCLTDCHPLSPKFLTGEIWFPTRQGKLKFLEQTCPFPWVKDYQAFYKGGEIIRDDLNNINDCLCGVPLLVADTESQMEAQLTELTNWVNETTLWEEN